MQGTAAGISHHEDLTRAIEELRGVLHDNAKPEAAPDASLDASGRGAASFGMNHALIMDIPVEVQIVLGSAEMPVSDLMALEKGSTVALNRRIGEAVDVVVNGRRLARGEITVLDDDPSRFGIRLTEVMTSAKPL